MICPNYPDPLFYIFSSQTPQILYYANIPAIIVSLLIGLFVFLKNRDIVSKILLTISVVFSFWSFFNLITWTNNQSDHIMFAWSFFSVLEIIFFAASFYFFYVAIKHKDLGFWTKLLIIIVISPIIILLPTKYNLESFDLSVCGVVSQNIFYIAYVFAFDVIVILSIVFLSIKETISSRGDEKKKIKYLSMGMLFFLLSFLFASYLSTILVKFGLANDFQIEQFGLFGMIVFMGLLAFLIVRYELFNIKLIGAEALMISLIILIASEFFFIPLDNLSNIILISITLLLAVIFGIMLIHSVKKEDQRKAELQLMSDKLASANDQLRKLDNTKSEFISIASHQLRTPLTAIKGFLSLLMEGSYGKMEEKQMDVINKVYTSNERLIALVEDLLNISRIESGRMEFKLEPWSIEGIVKEVVDTFVLKAKEHNLYLETKFMEDPLPKLTIDGGKVREVVSNFVDNAIKYTPKGGVNVKITREGANARVTVSDTGIGIPATELPYLFSKFSRGKDTSRLNTGGTGLGLYVGKSMIEANGGKVWAESEGEGRGSRFIIELPIEQSKEILERWG